MKRELLRINRLSDRYNRTRKLENVSLCILEGECVGFLGLTYSGKDLLVDLLTGKIAEGNGKKDIYLGGIQVKDWKELNGYIYRIHVENYQIDDWTVAEYLGLVESGGWGGLLRRGRLEEEAQRDFQELDLDFDVSCKIKHLTELEKRILDLAKAYRRGARIVVIEDEFDGMSRKDIEIFARSMHRIIVGRMGVIVSSHSNLILSLLSDKYIIFRKGRIVKKCQRDYIKSEEQLELYLLGGDTLSGRTENDVEKTRKGNVIYCVSNLEIKNGRKENLAFIRGEVVTLIALDRRVKEKVFMALSGRRSYEDAYYILNGNYYATMDCYELVKERVVSISALGSKEEIFEGMSVEENLMIPSLEKISSLDYIKAQKGIRKMTRANMLGSLETMKAGSLRIHELIQLTLERWLIFNPKVLILLEPFALCDVKDVGVVKNYIKKFQEKGTTVIIVNTRDEYIEDISDRTINIE